MFLWHENCIFHSIYFLICFIEIFEANFVRKQNQVRDFPKNKIPGNVKK
ncbi:Uncharacterized protein dnm_066200 [Desulfonema magnum]|uniref:Uncharacterized protein n=1 Tax=Desulfonema magnum TaxID=45655 RepID=A0A975BS35_9BACT|nr:Uncharacterized protein dnm_066200 [Desulfonema magnum]